MAAGFHTDEDEARYRELGLWGDKLLYDVFTEAVAKHAEKIAVTDVHGQYTYQELQQRVNSVAVHLYNRDIRDGDAVALQLPGWVEEPIVHLACDRIGAVFLPIHDGWRETETRHLLRKSQAKAIIVPASYRGFSHPEMILKLKDEGGLDALTTLVTAQGRYAGFEALDAWMQDTEAASKADELFHNLQRSPNDPRYIMVSSGTTSLPKMSFWTDNNLLTTARMHFGTTIQLTEKDRAAALAPPGTGSTGYAFPILAPLLVGASTVILEQWGDPAEAWALIERYGCTYATAIPTQMTKLVAVPDFEKRYDLHALRAFNNAGAPLPYATAKELEGKIGCAIHTIYGATDGGVPIMSSVSDPQEKRIGSVGRVLPGCEVVLCDPDLNSVPEGERGEIVWRTPSKSFGYLNDDEETARMFCQRNGKDGWFRSGDVGQFDEEGYLRIVGRTKDMILRGGRNISPRTIEELLITHPAVAEVAVAAMPDPVLGEKACAFVVLKPDATLTFDEMIDFLKAKEIAVWELPERLEVMEDLPKSGGGKIIKSELTKYVTEKLKAEGNLAD